MGEGSQRGLFLSAAPLRRTAVWAPGQQHHAGPSGSAFFTLNIRNSRHFQKEITMAKLSAVVTALNHYCGFSAARVRTVARRLLEAELLTPGAPGVAVEIYEFDFCFLLLAVASGVPLSRVAKATTDLAATVPAGTDAMPEELKPKGCAFDVLHDLVWSAVHGNGSLKADLEVVGQWPEVAFHTSSGVARYLSLGALPNRWQGSKARTSTTVPNSALALAVKNLFGDN